MPPLLVAAGGSSARDCTAAGFCSSWRRSLDKVNSCGGGARLVLAQVIVPLNSVSWLATIFWVHASNGFELYSQCIQVGARG